MVYRSDCRYLPYSIHFSEFMPKKSSQENEKNTRLHASTHFNESIFLWTSRRLKTFCRAVYTFMKDALERMRTEHLWMRHMSYDICVQCPLCSKGGVRGSACDIHSVDGCKQDQCLHYITAEGELLQSNETLVCFQPDDPRKTVISRETFSPWFEASDSKVCTTFCLQIYHLRRKRITRKNNFL